MNITTGMDIDQVRSLGQLLNQKAEEIQQITSAITAQLTSTGWLGPDATRFRGDWNGTHVAQLRAVMQCLQDASQSAAHNASQQETASMS